MEKLTKTGIIFYCVALAGVGIHQFFYADFCLFLFPHWPNPFPGYAILVYVFNVLLIAACVAIIAGKKRRTISLVLGGVLLLMLLLGQVPYEYIVIPYKKTHLGLWVLPLKELALVGGAFCIAGASSDENADQQNKPLVIRVLEKLIPFGGVFFSTTMILFGVSHFLYTPTVSAMVPNWLSWHDFWTYFAAVVLIAGGVAIVIRVWVRLAAALLGLMIFIWFVFLHTPDAVTNPLIGQGNEITAAFSALAFSGIGFVIAGSYQPKKYKQ